MTTFLIIVAGLAFQATLLWAVAHKIMRRKTYFAIQLCIDGYFVFVGVVGLILNHGTDRFWSAAVLLAALYFARRDYRAWCNSDDDEPRRRVRTWIRNHLPRPQLVAIRPIGVPT